MFTKGNWTASSWTCNRSVCRRIRKTIMVRSWYRGKLADGESAQSGEVWDRRTVAGTGRWNFTPDKPVVVNATPRHTGLRYHIDCRLNSSAVTIYLSSLQLSVPQSSVSSALTNAVKRLQNKRWVQRCNCYSTSQTTVNLSSHYTANCSRPLASTI